MRESGVPEEKAMRILYLIRGLPSSGKTQLGWDFKTDCMFAADDYFIVDGKYQFDPAKLHRAHEGCQLNTIYAMKGYKQRVVVHNTFTQRWEMEPYLAMARKYSYRVVVVSLFDGGCTDEELEMRSCRTHNVPIEAIVRMRERYEHDWKGGNPLPPWERQ